jgi:hypothetical protein
VSGVSGGRGEKWEFCIALRRDWDDRIVEIRRFCHKFEIPNFIINDAGMKIKWHYELLQILQQFKSSGLFQ